MQHQIVNKKPATPAPVISITKGKIYLVKGVSGYTGNVWVIATSNAMYNTFAATQLSTGNTLSLRSNQVVRQALPQEQFTLTHA